VLLTPEEIRVLVTLERVLDESVEQDPSSRSLVGPIGAARLRVLSAMLLLVRFVPWLAPVGVVLMLVALPSSVALSAAGALLAAAGSSCWIQRSWLHHTASRRRLLDAFRRGVRDGRAPQE
jgi:hypothetical protein